MPSRIKMKLNVAGCECMINTDEPEGYVRTLEKELNARISEAMRDSPKISTTAGAILAALSYCDEAKKARRSVDNMRIQLNEYLAEASRMRIEADELKRERDHLKRDITLLKAKIVLGDK